MTGVTQLGKSRAGPKPLSPVPVKRGQIPRPQESGMFISSPKKEVLPPK